MADRETQAQMVSRAEQRTGLNYQQRETVWALGRILLAGQTLNDAQEDVIRRICAPGVKARPMHPECTAPDCDCEPGIECAARGAARGVPEVPRG